MNDKLRRITSELVSIPKFGKGIGLHRMRYLCSGLLNSEWAKRLDPINVVGSNGKGSTTAIISAILAELKISYGKYTSPHLFDFTERIVTNGQRIPLDELEEVTYLFFEQRAKYSANFPGDEIGAFEAFTAIALNFFFKENVDAIVLEAGIGGRHDSTAILSGSHIAFTSLDLEHANILGPTLESIAFDKVDIAKDGANIILGDIQEDILLKIREYVKDRNIQVYPVKEHTTVKDVRFKNGKMLLDFYIEDYLFSDVSSTLIGYHQVNNILVATLLLKKWLSKNYPQILKEQLISSVKKALEKVKWTGRLEKIKDLPPTFIDVGHSPDALNHVVDSFKAIKKIPCVLIIGVSYDKDVAGIINQLLPIADVVVCTRAYHKGSRSVDIFRIVSDISGGKIPIFQYERIEDAVDFGINYADKNGMCVLIGGGLFLSIEAYNYIKGNSPKELDFF